MIIITDRAAELMGWIEANCASTTYTLEDEGRLFLNITAEDRLVWDLRWHGCFIQSPSSKVWHDDTPVVRRMLDLVCSLSLDP